MAFLNQLFGGYDSSQGANYQARGADVVETTNAAQAAQAQQQAQNALSGQQSFVNALQGQNGVQNQSNVFNQLSGIAAGQGPNPAQAALANATGANVANQAALMASQRGVSANPGMIARQAAMQGANMQQQAAGQAAALQAQQSLNAISQMGGIAGQQVGQQANALGNFNQLAQSNQNNIQNAINTQNANRINMQSNINNANAGVAQQNAQGEQQMTNKAVGGLFDSMGPATKLIGMADGGAVPAPKPNGPSSFVGQHLIAMAMGGKVPALLSPGEIYLPPQKVSAVASGKAAASKVGERIPGKAAVKGDSKKNDTVKKTLDAGGVVVPRTKAQSDNKAADFVAAVSARKKHKGGKK